MALITRIKSWIDRECLTHTDLNAEFSNITDNIIASDLTNKGMIERATDAEVASGTDEERAVTPAGMLARTGTTARIGLVQLEDSHASVLTTKAPCSKNVKEAYDKAVTHYVQFRILDKDTSHTTGTGKGGELRIPEACTVLGIGAYFDTAGTTSVTTIDINEAGVSILSTKITVDATEKSSGTAATAPVISDSAIAADAILTFDIDGIASGVAGKGLVVWLKVKF